MLVIVGRMVVVGFVFVAAASGHKEMVLNCIAPKIVCAGKKGQEMPKAQLFFIIVTLFENYRKSLIQHSSRQKLIKNAKNCPFWRVFENLQLAVKQRYQTGHY